MISTEQASRGFSAAGSEARLHVLRALVRAGPSGLRVGEIQERLGIPSSTLAHHLRSLADGGLIEQEKSGRTVLNRADFSHIRGLADFLLEECCADEQSEVPCCPPGTDMNPTCCEGDIT